MGVQDGLAFWNALKGKIQALVKQDTANCLRCARYDVTTAPNGTKIGVRLPEGNKEILIPYSKEVVDARVGDTVLVIWYGAMSTAKAYYFGIGYEGYEEPEPPAPVFTEYLNVFGDVGASITAVSGSTTYSGTIPSTGVLTLTVLVQGTYTVTSTLSGVTRTATVVMNTSGATQSVDLRTQSFSAALWVQSYAGASITVTSTTGGSASYSGTVSDLGLVSIMIYEPDTYRVTATYVKSSTTYTDYEDVTISENGATYDVYIFLPVPMDFQEVLNVYADVGATVTAVCGQTTYTDTAPAIGRVTFDVRVAGTYTVTATLGSDTKSDTVSMTANGAIQTIDLRSSSQTFVAYLTVSTNPGASVSVESTDTGTRYTDTASSSGVATFTIYESGTFRIVAWLPDEGNASATRIMAMTTNGYFYSIELPITVERHYLYLLGNKNEEFAIDDDTITFDQEGLQIMTLNGGGLHSYTTAGACMSMGNVSVDTINESITCYDARCLQTNFWAFILGRTDPNTTVTANDGNGHVYSGTATSSGYVAFAVNTSGTYTVSEMVTSAAQTATLNVSTTGITYEFDFRTFDGTLFNEGDEYTKFTGGWRGSNSIVATAYDSSIYSYTTPMVYRTNGTLKAVIMSGAAVGSLITTNKLSVSDYDTLEIRYLLNNTDSGTGTVKMFVHNGSQVRASKTLTRSADIQTTTLDITPAHGWGTCYIGIEIEADASQHMEFNLYYAALKNTGTSQISGGGGLSL